MRLNAFDLLQGVSAVLGILGFFAAIWMYRRQQNSRKLFWIAETLTVLGPDLTRSGNGIQVHVNGEEVYSLSHSTIFIWNAGNTEIRKEDVSVSNPLKLQLGGDKLYGQIDCVSSDPHSMVQFEIVDNQDMIGLYDSQFIRIAFSYLNPGEGFRIKFFHRHAASIITFNGSIIGANACIERRDKFASRLQNDHIEIYAHALTFLLLFLAYLIFPYLFGKDSLFYLIGVPVAIFLIVVVHIFGLSVVIRRSRRRQPPQKLR
jgi:hypothetical protein